MNEYLPKLDTSQERIAIPHELHSNGIIFSVVKKFVRFDKTLYNLYVI
jgi:hypothetical protein